MTYMDAFRSFMVMLTSQTFYYVYHIVAVAVFIFLDPILLGYYVVGWMLGILVFSFLHWRLSIKYEDFYVS